MSKEKPKIKIEFEESQPNEFIDFVQEVLDLREENEEKNKSKDD